MIVPIEWLKQYVQTDKTTPEIGESLTSLGLMVDKPSEKFNKGEYNSDVLSLEHRMDRSDWLSIIGVARDLAAFENTQLIYPELYTKPGKKPDKANIVDIKVTCPEIVKRFNTCVFRGVQVQNSPDWLRNRLEAYGIPSINNIVDITNYVMVELGQPMHAQDIHKMEKPEIIIRRAKPGEEVITLLGETIKLDPGFFVLTQGDKATVIGGIVGGINTAVDESTTDIILDAGNYDQNTIRKNSRKLKVQNETVLRYDKYLHPKLTEIGIQRAIYLIQELAGGEFYENVDWYPKQYTEKEMILRYSRLHKLSGMEIEKDRVKEIISKLEYEITKEDEHNLYLKVPYFRTDVEVEDDLVADILRINNYTNIPISFIETTPPKEITQEIYKFEDRLRDILTNIGLHEHITDPLVKYDESYDCQIKLENALSSEKDALRTSIYETLHPVLDIYKKQRIKETGVFEIGKIYYSTGNSTATKDLKEERMLQVIYNNENTDILDISNKIKSILGSLLQNLGIKNVTYEKFGNMARVVQGETELGSIAYDSFNLFTERLLRLAGQTNRVIFLHRNESVEDLSIIIPENTPFGPIYQTILGFNSNIVDVNVIETYTGGKIPLGTKSLLVRIYYTGQNFAEEKGALLNILKNEYEVEIREQATLN